jgi:hypothetical protein
MALTSPTYQNQMLDSLTGGATNLATHISLHSATTLGTGASEFSGGGYARQTMTWNAASGGTRTNSGTASFTTSGGTAATHLGTFSASTSGTFGLGFVLGSSVTATTITVAAGALTATAT